MNIPFSKISWGPEEEEALVRVGRSGWLAAGPETEAFEREFAAYVGVNYAIFTNSCTSALKMAYKYLREARPSSYGSYRLCYPRNTFCATYAAAQEVGFNRLQWYQYLPNEQKVRLEDCPRKAPMDDEVLVIASMHYGGVKEVRIRGDVEDSAHRIEPNDPLVGKIRCYSFYATKNMTTGSGGMLVTNDKEIYDRCRLYWRDGLTTSTRDRGEGIADYEVKVAAGGYDGNDLAAAVGRVQLRRLPELTARRNAVRDRYNDAFGLEWGGNHLFPYFISSEEEVRNLRKFLWDNGIGSGHHYPGTGWLGVSLPIYPDLSHDDQETVIEKVKEWHAAHPPIR